MLFYPCSPNLTFVLDASRNNEIFNFPGVGFSNRNPISRMRPAE